MTANNKVLFHAILRHFFLLIILLSYGTGRKQKQKKNPDICSKKEKYCLATRSCVCVDIVRLPSTLPHSATAVADPARRAVKTETGESQVVEERSFRIYKIPQRNLRSCRRRRRTQKPKQQQNETMATFCVTGFTLSKVKLSAQKNGFHVINRVPSFLAS